MTQRAYHRFPLSTAQFESLVAKASSRERLSDIYYDDDQGSLMAKGWLLRERCTEADANDCGKWNLDMLGEGDGVFTRHDYGSIVKILSNTFEDTFCTLVGILSFDRYHVPLDVDVPHITYVERVNFSVREDFLVGTSTLPRHVVEPLLGLSSHLDPRPSRSRIAEYLNGWEPESYDKLVEKGFISTKNWCCSRKVNRPEVNNGITFAEAQKLWHHLED